jgi:exodeoxyribonuclease VII large subunit
VTTPSTAESPWPVRTVTRKIAEWIARLGSVWVEGQVAQLSRRPGASICFLTLRDPAADVSLQVTCPPAVLDAVEPAIAEGARVIAARCRCGPPRSALSASATCSPGWSG